MDMTQALKKLTAVAEANCPSAKPVTDEMVMQRLESMALKGYIPNEQTIAIVRDYLAGHGLILRGNTGVGKTFLFRCLGVPVYDCKKICADYGFGAIDEFYRWTDTYEICLDDLGVEQITGEYGIRDEVMAGVIAHREARHMKTHITTNMSAEQINERYGARTLSRILGMCKPHVLSGKNYRTAKSQ